MAEEELFEKIKALPPELQKGVASFVDMLSGDLMKLQPRKDRSNIFGALRGKIAIREGFDDPIEGMEDYM